MAPSGNNVPQRFRQRRHSPTLNDLTKKSSTANEESVKSSAEAQKQWENLLDRRKKCKERHFQDRYDLIKKELTDATTSLARLDQKATTGVSFNSIGVHKVVGLQVFEKICYRDSLIYADSIYADLIYAGF